MEHSNGAVHRLIRCSPAIYFPGSSANEVETAAGNPITIASGEPYTPGLVHWINALGMQGDGIVATIMAIGRAMVAQEQPQPSYQVFWV